MRRLLLLLAFATASAQQPTLQQILSAPYALSLTAAPTGNHFAWIENAEGRRNIWIGAANEPAHQLTKYTEDDGQDIASLTWSPDATLLAYTRGGTPGADGKPANPAHLQHPTAVEIFILPTTAGDPIKLTEGHSPLFTHDGKSILFIRSGQIWTARIPPPKPTAKPSSDDQSLLNGILSLVASVPIPDTAKQLVFDPGTASSLTPSPDGKLLAYVSHRESRSLIALYTFETKALRFLSTSTSTDSAPTFSLDGKQIAWLRAPATKVPEFATNRTSPNPWSIQLADLTADTTRTLFTPEPNEPGSVLPHMSTGEPHLYFTADNRILFFSEKDAWLHLYSVDSSGKEPPTFLTPGWHEIEDVAINPQGTTIVYASSEAPVDRDHPAATDIRHIWRMDLHAPYFRRQLSTAHIETHPQITSDGTVSALISTTDRPMFAARLMGPTGYVGYHFPAAPSTALAPEDFAVPQQVLFKSTGNLQLHAQLFLPKSPTPTKHPAILFVHGGPDRQMLLGYPSTDYYSNMYAMNQYLALHGYIVLSVNYRCGIGYGLNFRQCEHSGADGAAEYADILAAATYLRSRPDVDTAHIGIYGGSYGGYLTALALARNSDIFAAGVDIHGVAEWSLEANAKSNWLYGPDVEKIAATAHASSPMADIATWRSPVLLIAGDNDPDVAYAQTTTLAAALRARNIPVEELIFPDEVHDFLLHKDWLAAFQATADFFDRTLKPTPSTPTPLK